jgi:hypothetical protein
MIIRNKIICPKSEKNYFLWVSQNRSLNSITHVDFHTLRKWDTLGSFSSKVSLVLHQTIDNSSHDTPIVAILQVGGELKGIILSSSSCPSYAIHTNPTNHN